MFFPGRPVCPWKTFSYSSLYCSLFQTAVLYYASHSIRTFWSAIQHNKKMQRYHREVRYLLPMHSLALKMSTRFTLH